jgi:hypothetical protein
MVQRLAIRVKNVADCAVVLGYVGAHGFVFETPSCKDRRLRGEIEKVPRYYFDTRDDDKFICDDEGVELPDIQAAAKAAARSLAEFALEVLPSSNERCLGVDVRDDRQQVLTTELTYRAVILLAKSDSEEA